MTYRIRDLDPTCDEELATVTRWSMRTVLSTIPELENSPDKARAVLPNFTFDQMMAMFRADLVRPTHRFLVAVDAEGGLVGHSMIFRKQTPEGETFGYFFTRFVLPEHRRRGLGSRLMAEAMAWFAEDEPAFLLAHTHATNTPLQRLFAAHGFQVVARSEEPWPHLTLRREWGPAAAQSP